MVSTCVLLSFWAPVVVVSQSVIESASLLQAALAKRNTVMAAVDVGSKAARLDLFIQQTNQQLQDSRAIADAVLAGGPSQIPTDAAMKLLTDQFTLLKEEVAAERDVNQKMVGDANKVVKQCNTAKESSFTDADGVNALAATVDTSRSSHSSCRSTEQVEIKAKAKSCLVFANVEKKCSDAQWFANDGKAEAVAAAQQCVADGTTASEKSQECVQKQGQFELDFCSYSVKLKATCSALTACRSAALAMRLTSIAEAEELVASHKAIHISVVKIECILDVLKKARTENITQANVDHCTAKTVDTTHLEITKNDPVAAESCDFSPVANLPGDAAWQSQEYVGLSGLEQMRQCTTTTTTTTTTPPMTTPTTPTTTTTNTANLALACSLGGVKLMNIRASSGRVEGELSYKNAAGEWQPVCGHFFWDGNAGAEIACKKAGYATGQILRSGKTMAAAGMQIGACPAEAQVFADCGGRCGPKNLCNDSCGVGGPWMAVSCSNLIGTDTSSCE